MIYQRTLSLVYVFSSFFSLNLFQVHGIDISVQKIAYVLIAPLVILNQRRFPIPRKIVMLGAALILLYLFSFFVNQDVAGLSALLVSVLSFLFAALLIINFKITPGLFIFTLKSWVYVAAACSVIAGLQFFGVVGYIGHREDIDLQRLVSGGYFRGEGLAGDPNFFALLLLVGVVMLIYLRRKQLITTRRYSFLHIMLILGVLFSQSRMGQLLYLCVALYWFFSDPSRNIIIVVKWIPVTAILSVLAIALAPQGITAGFQDRAHEVVDTLFSDAGRISTNDIGNITSSSIRYILLVDGIRAANEKFATGWGVGNSISAINSKSLYMINNVSHNTYLEFYIVFGVLGLLFLFLYFILIYPRDKIIFLEEFRFSRLLLIVFFVAGFFLSVIYSMLLWLPLIFAFGSRYCVANTEFH